MKQIDDDISWFVGTREGDELATLQNSYRLTFEQKLKWLEEAALISRQLQGDKDTSSTPHYPPMQNSGN